MEIVILALAIGIIIILVVVLSSKEKASVADGKIYFKIERSLSK